MELENVVERVAEQVERRFHGKYRGFVVDNADPEQLGRLRLSVPSLLGEEVVTGWAMPCVPFGGLANQGLYFVPEVEAGVWVEFEEGDLEFPIWVGTFWSKPGGETEVPLPHDADGEELGEVRSPPTSKVIKTGKGHTLQFEDADGEEKIVLVDGVHGHVVTLDQEGIRLTDGINDHTVTLDGEGIRVVEGTQGHEVVLDGEGIAIKDARNGHEIVLDGAGVAIDSANGVVIRGVNVEIEAQAQLTLKGNPIHMIP